MLCQAATTAGADRIACDAFLASDEGILEEQTQVVLERLGILLFRLLIGGKVIISGAVHSSELVRVFREVEKAESVRRTLCSQIRSKSQITCGKVLCRHQRRTSRLALLVSELKCAGYFA